MLSRALSHYLGCTKELRIKANFAEVKLTAYRKLSTTRWSIASFYQPSLFILSLNFGSNLNSFLATPEKVIEMMPRLKKEETTITYEIWQDLLETCEWNLNTRYLLYVCARTKFCTLSQVSNDKAAYKKAKIVF